VLPEYRDTWKQMGTEEIFAEVRRLSERPILITLSGGNPALQPFGELIERGKGESYGFAIETQGTVAKDWFAGLDYLTISPKPPSSGMPTNWEKLGRCVAAGGENAETVFKVVVFDDANYAYAREVAERFPDVSTYLQVGNDNPPGADPGDAHQPDEPLLLDRYAWLSEKVLADGWNEATVLPQLHVLIHGNKRGV
jgi:7-carboxy-7-deazaguanine synthase